MYTIGTIIGWAMFGLVIGAIARLLVPGRQAMGLFMTMVMGIVGSLVGGFLWWVFSGTPEAAYHPGGWILAIMGAVIVVWIYAESASRRTA